MKKITFIFSFLIVGMAFSQTTLREFTFPDAASVTADMVQTATPSAVFVPLQEIANAADPEASFSYNAGGNGTGAIEFTAVNPDDGVGKNYSWRIVDNQINFMGATDLEVSFDVRRVGDLVGTNFFVEVFYPQDGGGFAAVPFNNLETTSGFGESYINITLDVNPMNFNNAVGEMFIQFGFGAGAFVGAGGTILVDNITVTNGDSGPSCSDGMMNGMETGVDCGGPDCNPCPADDPTTDAPDPTNDPGNVLSVYSNTYGFDVTNFNFNAFNGGGTIEEVDIEGNGNTAGRIEDYAFYGAGWDPVDASSYNFVHLDYYATDATVIEFFMIDQSLSGTVCCGSAEEPRYTIALAGGDETLVPGEWRSVAIPMTQFTNYGPLVSGTFDGTDIFQWKFVGDGEVYFDNIFFSTDGLSINEFSNNTFKVFPNPTDNDWNVIANQSITSVKLYDILGKEVMSMEPNALETTISTENVKTGVYFARVQSESGSKTIRLIKR